MMNYNFRSLKYPISDLLVSETCTVRTLLKQMDKGALGVVLLEESGTRRFKALLTDGDVRRALLKGVSLNDPASEIHHPETVTAHVNTPIEDIVPLFSEKIRFIPLIDDEFRVVDIGVYDSRALIPVASPVFYGNELRYINECVLTGWVSSAGKYVEHFEKMFATYCNAQYAVSTSSGTTALHLALLALGVGPGDEVIVPALTFISTANAVRFTGAEPVFVDSEIESWNIDPNLIEKAITDRTRCVIPVHLYGYPANMDSILSLAKKYGLFVIEDAAEAHGTLYKGRKVGCIGDIGMFSFYGNKTITTGEGGMVVTNDDSLAGKIRLFRDHGMDPNCRYLHTVLGYNYRMTNVQAALGVAQMEYIDSIVENKIGNAMHYNRELECTPGITLPPQSTWARNTYWLYSILINEKKFGISASQLSDILKSKKIDTRPLFRPIHKQPIYDTGQNLPISESLHKTGVSLPSSVGLCKSQIQKVAEEIRSARA